PPPDNAGANPKCKKDHFIALQLGGADTLDNIWPQCVTQDDLPVECRDFNLKDRVATYLRGLVNSNQMTLEAAQREILSDWTRYLGAAVPDELRKSCPNLN